MSPPSYIINSDLETKINISFISRFVTTRFKSPDRNPDLGMIQNSLCVLRWVLTVYHFIIYVHLLFLSFYSRPPSAFHSMRSQSLLHLKLYEVGQKDLLEYEKPVATFLNTVKVLMIVLIFCYLPISLMLFCFINSYGNFFFSDSNKCRGASTRGPGSGSGSGSGNSILPLTNTVSIRLSGLCQL